MEPAHGSVDDSDRGLPNPAVAASQPRWQYLDRQPGRKELAINGGGVPACCAEGHQTEEISGEVVGPIGVGFHRACCAPS